MPKIKDKSFVGIENNLAGKNQNFIDEFSKFLKKSSDFKGEKTTVEIEETPITRRFVDKVTPPKENHNIYGTKEVREDIEKLIQIAKESQILRVGYVEITQAVINTDKNPDNISDNLGDFLAVAKSEFKKIIDDFKSDIESKKSNISSEENSKKDAIICFGKAIEHARLAHVQYNSLYLETQNKVNDLQNELQTANSNMEKSREELQELQDALNESGKKIEDYKETLSKLSEQQSSIYTEFIAILGVFSSFVFVMFGGFDAITSVTKNLGSGNVHLPRTIFIASILAAFLFTILYALLLWVSKIINRPMVNGACACSEYPCKKLIRHTFRRHLFYSTIMLVDVVIIILSFILSLNIK